MLRLNRNKKNLRKKGTILGVTLFLCILATMAALWMMKTLLDHSKTNKRRQDISRAYYAAEAGLFQVIHWGNFPKEYDNLGEQGLFYRDKHSGEFPNLTALFSTQAEFPIPLYHLSSFTSKYKTPVSKIVKIVLIAPDPPNDPVPCVFKVYSEGETNTGVKRRILAYLGANPLGKTSFRLGAALVSMTVAAMGGNAKVHWGESWSKGSFNLPSKSQLGHLDWTNFSTFDPWAKYRTEGYIIFGSTWKVGVGQDIYDPANRRFPGTTPASGKYTFAFEHMIPAGTLQFPNFLAEYQNFKNQALLHGRYYGTDASGNIYRDGIKDLAHKIDFVDEFEFANREAAPYDLVFIDTIDGTAPKPDGSNLATLTISGQTTGIKGIFWIGANYVQTGTGNPSPLLAQRPDLVKVQLENIYLDGVIYSAGTMNLGGNPRIYGAAAAEKGFVGSGTPDIYYNAKLKDGLDLPVGNIGSVFQTILQKNF